MTEAERLLTQSKYFPRSLNGVFPKNPQYFSVDPLEFSVRRDVRVSLNFQTRSNINFVKQETEKARVEHTIMLYGRTEKLGCSFEFTEWARGTQTAASYTEKQKEMTRRFLGIRNGEVMYGHTHVANGSVYNNFSLTDLSFFVEQALLNRRDVYAILITKDRYTMVMYSYKEKEFFRIQC